MIGMLPLPAAQRDTGMDAINAKDLTKHFFHRRGIFGRRCLTAVNNVTLSVRKGEAFGLLGPNGAGKTTLIKMLTTLITPSKGELFVNGYGLREEKKIKGSISLIYPGERSFYHRLTGRQNLEFFAALHGIHPSPARVKIGGLLKTVGLSNDADVWFEKYSSGMKQRLAVARGLLNDPEIIFMDEPTKGLDPIEARRFRRFVREFLSGEKRKTVFLATHQLDEAEDICDRVAVMDSGEIKICGMIGEFAGSGRTGLYDLLVRTVDGGKS